MSGSNAVDQCDQSSRAMAPSCAVVKHEQTSPTAGELAVATRTKSVSPTSTKKAWRQRLEMDEATSSLAASSTSAAMEVKPFGGLDGKTGGPAQLQQSQLFVCRQCGKCFITLKYLEMHNALHACQSKSTTVLIQPTVQSRPATDQLSVQSQLSVLPPRQPTMKADLSVAVLQPAAASASSSARYKDWTCEICRKKFSQNSSYKNHQRTHSDERPFVCTVCSIGFKERYHLKKHTLFKHSNETREQCRICGKRFKDSTAVRAHERIHSDARPYSCRRCSKAFKTSECLWHHENRSKSCGALALQQPPQPLQQVPGEVVRRRGRKRSRLSVPTAESIERQMSTTDSSSGDFICMAAANAASFPVINIPSSRLTTDMPASRGYPHFTDVATSLSTLSSSAQLELPPGIGSGVNIPGQANQVLSRAANSAESTHREGLVLLANCAVSQPADVDTQTQVKVEPEVVLADYELTAINSPEASFYERKRMAAADTATSSQTLSTLGDLHVSPLVTGSRSMSPADKNGRQLTTLDGGIECRVCCRHFATTAAYNKHAMQAHRENRPYRCEECDVGFKLRVHLKKHTLYRHSDLYQCACRHCGKRFKDSSAVRLHERIHSSDRPFPCPTCSKTFKTRENLWGHRHRGPCGLLNQTMSRTRCVKNEIVDIATEEQMIVDSEVLIHGGDLIQPPSSDPGMLISPSSSAITTDQHSVAVVEAAGKALVWAYDRPAFYVGPTAVLSSVPTAVVTPIKREVPDTEVEQCEPSSAFEPSMLCSSTPTMPAPLLSKAHLPPFETFRAPAISGGSSSSASSTESISSAMNLSLPSRSVKSDFSDVTEALPLPSLYRYAVTSSSGALFTLPVWNMPTVSLADDAGTQLGSIDELVASTNNGELTCPAHALHNSPAVTVAYTVASSSVFIVSNEVNVSDKSC